VSTGNFPHGVAVTGLRTRAGQIAQVRRPAPRALLARLTGSDRNGVPNTVAVGGASVPVSSLQNGDVPIRAAIRHKATR